MPRLRAPALLPLLLSVALAAPGHAAPTAPASPFYLGADLSFTNEMEDCGAAFRAGRQPADPFVLLKQHGGNLVRVRIWHDATWTRYSGYDDVLKTIAAPMPPGCRSCSIFTIRTTGPMARSRSRRSPGRG